MKIVVVGGTGFIGRACMALSVRKNFGQSFSKEP